MPDANGKGGRIREILYQLQGVLDVAVDEGPKGIDGISIRVADPAAARQVTRDVESALFSGLGLEIDHRLIRIEWDANGRQTNGREALGGDGFEPGDDDHLPAQWLQRYGRVESPGREAEGRRVRLVAVRCAPEGGRYVEITVELEVAGQSHTARVQDADTARGRLLCAGRATLQALAGTFDEDAAFVLEGIEEIAVSDAQGLLAVLSARVGRERPVFHGSVILQGDPLEAAARAVLDALNRFQAARGRAA
ncbi:hypothetical protein BH18GEM1_BH18GEM1_19250 [soil metagenome]